MLGKQQNDEVWKVKSLKGYAYNGVDSKHKMVWKIKSPLSSIQIVACSYQHISWPMEKS